MKSLTTIYVISGNAHSSKSRPSQDHF
jgi:hypothetical protein